MQFTYDWAKIRRLSGKFQFFCFPMNKQFKEKYREKILQPLEDKISQQIGIKMGQIDKDITEHMDIEIQASAEILVKDLYKNRGWQIFRNLHEIRNFFYEEEPETEAAPAAE